MFLSFLVPFRSMVRGSSHPSVDILVLVPYSNHGTRTRMSTDKSRASNQRSSTRSRRGFSRRAGPSTRSRRGFLGELKLELELVEGFLEELKLVHVIVEFFCLLVLQPCHTAPLSEGEGLDKGGPPTPYTKKASS
jgi:hypothetical protein